MGSLISAFLNFWRPKNEQSPIFSTDAQSDPDFIDPAIRQKAEKSLRDKGVIGGSHLNTARGFEAAYRRVMKDVITSNSIKSDLYIALAHESGTKTYEKFLLPKQWEWPEFDKWKAIFTQDGNFPYMWKKYPEICMPPFEEFNISRILEQMLVKDIKIFLNNAQIDIPLKAKKAELIALAEQNLNVQIFCELMPELYNSLQQDYSFRVNHGKCAILSHTIGMLGCQLRDFYTNSRLKLNPISGCPVEAKYAKGRGRVTEDNIPPFFPGDRTGVIFMQRH